MIVYFIATFIVGALAGCGAVFIWGIALMKSERKTTKELPKKSGSVGSDSLPTHIQKSLQDAGAMIRIQDELLRVIDQVSATDPSQTSDLIDEWEKLEKDKRALFSDILNQGYDPELAVFDGATNSSKSVKLSALVSTMDSRKSRTDAALSKMRSAIGEEKSNLSLDSENTTIKRVDKNGKIYYLIQNNDDTIH